MKIVQIINQNHPEVQNQSQLVQFFLASSRGSCRELFARLLWHYFSPKKAESRLNTAIHMLFYEFRHHQVWINAKHES